MVTGRTYVEMNIIAYFIVIPCMVGFARHDHWNKSLPIFVGMCFLCLRKDFRTFSEWLFSNTPLSSHRPAARPHLCGASNAELRSAVRSPELHRMTAGYCLSTKVHLLLLVDSQSVAPQPIWLRNERNKTSELLLLPCSLELFGFRQLIKRLDGKNSIPEFASRPFESKFQRMMPITAMLLCTQ